MVSVETAAGRKRSLSGVRRSSAAVSAGPVLASRTSRDTDAALFYFTRALRKLRLAGMQDGGEHRAELRELVAAAEAQAERLRAPPALAAAEVAAKQQARAAQQAADAGESNCVIS